MNKLKRWLLQHLINEAVRKRQTQLPVKYLWDACRKYFHEDNIPTREHYLSDLFNFERNLELEEYENIIQMGDPKGNP